MTADTSSLEAVAGKVLDIVAGRADAAVVVSDGPEALTRFANSFIHQNVSEDGTALVLKVSLEGRTATAATTATDDDSLRRLADQALEAARLRPADPHYPGMAPSVLIAGTAHWDDATAAADPAARAAVVGAFVGAGPALEAAGFCATRAKHAAFANTAGQRATGRMTSAALDGIHRSKGGDGAGRAASVSIDAIDGDHAGAVAAEKARAQDGELLDIEPGHYEVVVEPGCVANMLLFLGGSGFNAKALAEGRSFVHLGEQQFDDLISIWDDASDPRTVGYLYDAEGTPKQRVDLVAQGVTSMVLHDRRTAGMAGAESTGHASGDDAIGPTLSNAFVGEGSKTREELIASVARGLLITDFHYTRILDPKTQVVTGLTRNGLFLIERGEIVGAVKNVRFTQSYVAALGPGKVLGVGSDAQLITGSQLGGFAHVPSLHLASWNVTGGARG